MLAEKLGQTSYYNETLFLQLKGYIYIYIYSPVSFACNNRKFQKVTCKRKTEGVKSISLNLVLNTFFQ